MFSGAPFKHSFERAKSDVRNVIAAKVSSHTTRDMRPAMECSGELQAVGCARNFFVYLVRYDQHVGVLPQHGCECFEVFGRVNRASRVPVSIAERSTA